MAKYGFGAYDIDTGKKMIDKDNIGIVKKLIEKGVWS